MRVSDGVGVSDEAVRGFRDTLLRQLKEMDATRRLGAVHPIVQELVDKHGWDVTRTLSDLIHSLETGDWGEAP